MFRKILLVVLFLVSVSAYAYNDEVAIDGSSDLMVNKKSAVFQEKPSDPSAPPANKIKLYAKDKAGTTTFYTKDSASNVVELGAAGGDVTSVGDCADGACLDGSSDGGTYVRLYDGDSNYTQIGTADILADRIINFGTMTDARYCTYTAAGTVINCDTVGAGAGDSVTVNTAEVDTTANFAAGDVVWTLNDGGAGGPDDVIGNLAADVVDRINFNWSDFVGLFGSIYINWSDINSAEIQASGINWSSLSEDVGTSAINWDTVDNMEIQSAGINWSDLSGDIDTSAIDWTSVINQEIQSAGINWSDVNADEIQEAGINWSSISNFGTGRVLRATAASVNWSDFSAFNAATETRCIYFEDPTDADDFKSIWFAKKAFTLTSLWCESDQTVTAMLQVDDGSPADVDDTDLTCDSTPPEDTALNGDTSMAAGDRLDLDVFSTSGTPTWCSICWTGHNND